MRSNDGRKLKTTEMQVDGGGYTINSQAVTVEERDSSGNVKRCSGTVTITDAGSGYAVGCIYRKTNGGIATTLYINEGTSSSCDFNAMETAGSINQGAQTAKTISATLTAAELLTGIITVNQGAGATSAQQLPLATSLDSALPTFAASNAFDFYIINISTVDAEDASVTTNTGWTLVGNMDVHAYSAAGSLNSSAHFRARKTAAGAWTLYRLS